MLLDSRGGLLLQTTLSRMNLLSFANLPGRFNALPLPLDGVGIRAILALNKSSYRTLSVVLQRSLRRAILSQRCLPLRFSPGVLADLPDRFSDLSFRPEAVEVCALRWFTSGPVMDLTVALNRWRRLHRSITIQPGLILPHPFGAAQDLLGWHGVAQILMPAISP